MGRLISATLEPTLEKDQRHGPLVVARATESVVVERLDPAFLGTGAIAAKREPHQAASGLTRHALALEQQVAQHRLGATIALGSGKLEPTRRLMRVALARRAAFSISSQSEQSFMLIVPDAGALQIARNGHAEMRPAGDEPGAPAK